MSRLIALFCTLSLLGCGPTTPPAPSSPTPVAEAVPAKTAISPSVPEEPTAKPTSAPTPEPPKAPAPPRTFKAEMIGLTACDRATDGLTLAEPEACLQPARKARAALLQANGGEELAATLSALLTHAEPTVVLYTLTEHRAHLKGTGDTVATLDALIDSLVEPIAEAAAIARLGLNDVEPAQTKERALALFDTHNQRRVRHAACRHLGQPAYKGDRAVFKTLVATAKAPERGHLLRSCSAREAGHIATPRDLKTLIGLLDTLDIQQPTIVGLQRGLGTPKAIAAYVKWFDRHATRPDKLHWTALHVFLPWDKELARMPRKPTIKALRRIASHRDHTGQIRALAIEGLKRMKAEEALAKLRKESTPEDPAEVVKALGG